MTPMTTKPVKPVATPSCFIGSLSKGRAPILILVSAAVVLGCVLPAWGQTSGTAASSTTSSPAATSEKLSPHALLPIAPIRGLWVWRREFVVDPAKRSAMLAFCVTHRFNRLLIQMRTQPPAPGSDAAAVAPLTFADADAWRDLLREAAAHAITIEALEGGREMGLIENHPTTLARLDALLAFNRTQPADQKIAGVHYDIEPYLLPQWKTPERGRVMEQFLQLLVAARARLQSTGPSMTLAADIPFWLDRKTEPGDSCVLSFNGQTKNFHQHIQDLTDYVAIMSYRQKALGPNSMAAHINDELEYAHVIGKSICAAAEVQPIKDAPTTSFFGLPPETFVEQMHLLQNEFARDDSFAGVIVHCYDGLPAYLQSTPAGP